MHLVLFCTKGDYERIKQKGLGHRFSGCIAAEFTKEGSAMSSHTLIHSNQTMWERGEDFSVGLNYSVSGGEVASKTPNHPLIPVGIKRKKKFPAFRFSCSEVREHDLFQN